MFRKPLFIIAFVVTGIISYSQGHSSDTTGTLEIKEAASIDSSLSSLDLDILFMDELEAFLDSILNPKSFFMGSMSLGRGYFNLTSKNNVFLQTQQRFTYTPNLGYFHKGGLSLTANGNIVNVNDEMNFYQFSLSPGFDYLKNRNFASGLTYTRFFTKDSLPFYTTPLQNEIYAYFTYRKWWLRPSVAVSYGWGSRSDYETRQSLVQDLRLRRSGFTRIDVTETISDFSLITSLRHDFYWLDVFSRKDHFRFTPQLSFITGTQKFGFNQSANTYATVIRTGANVLYNSENVYLDDELEFQPLSMTMFLRGEYSIGKFFLQPQLVLDYYFPASEKNFSTLFSCNLGFIF